MATTNPEVYAVLEEVKYYVNKIYKRLDVAYPTPNTEKPFTSGDVLNAYTDVTQAQKFLSELERML